MTTLRLIAATALATVCLAAPALAASAGDTILVSRPSTFGPLTSPTTNDSLSAFADEGELRTIADGHRYIVFQSEADGMVADDDNSVINVFVRDRLLKTTKLVSRANGPAGAAANGSSGWATISANGRFVAFASNATNLAPGVTGSSEHVYVRDIVSGTTTLVDRADGADGAVGNDDAFDPSIIVSGGNPVVAFTSFASNLDGDNGGRGQVYLRMQGSTTMLSRQNGSATIVGNGTSSNPSLSADGSSVAFQSDATNLTTISPGGVTQIFMRKVGTLLTLPVSWIGLWGNADSTSPSVNKDGSVVAFQSEASNFGDGDADHTTDIHLRDMSVLDMTLGSVRSGVKGNGPSVQPVITDDVGATSGALVFTSSATNLSGTPDTNGFPDIFARTGLFGTGSTTLVSRDGTTQSDGPSGGASITRNPTGDTFNLVRLVVYETDARNLGPDDDDDFSNVYGSIFGGLVVGSRNALISRPDGDAPFRSGVNTSTLRPQQRGDEPVQSMSQNGRYTVFLSSSDELSPIDDNRWINVFRRDNLTGDTVLISRANGASGAAANGTSATFGGGLSIGFGGVNGAPSISADGNRIAFSSAATNLVPGDTNDKADVFVRDVAAGTTVLASRKDDDTQVLHGANDPAISGDGTKVAWVTDESLEPGDAGTNVDVYLRDLAAGTTKLVSRKGANGPSGNDDSGGPAVDFDGSRVAFLTTATDFSAIPDANLSPDIWVRDVSAGLVIPVTIAAGGAAMANKGGTGPAINADGTRVAFASTSANLGASGDVNGAGQDVFMRDLAAGSTVLVSRTNGINGVSGNNFSQRPSMDTSGNRIAFETNASDLFPGDSNGASDVGVRDVAAGTTELVSRGAGPGGAQAAGHGSGTPAISANGQCVAFETTADSFAPMPAGTDFTRVVARALGSDCAFGPVAPPPPPPPPGGSDKTAPVVTAASLKPTRFVAGKKVRKAKGRRKAVGAKLRFTLSEAASLTVRIDALTRGRRNAKGKCVKPSRAPKGKRCTRAVRKGSIRKAGVAGANTVKITGRLKGKNLKPGRYRLRLTAKDAAGNTSKALTITFRIVKR